MNINPGKLNKKIQIIQIINGTDAEGFNIDKEKIIKETYAQFNRVSGTEISKNNSDFSKINVRFLIRYTKVSINENMIVKYLGEDYDIIYINNYADSNEYIEIWCKKVTI